MIASKIINTICKWRSGQKFSLIVLLDTEYIKASLYANNVNIHTVELRDILFKLTIHEAIQFFSKLFLEMHLTYALLFAFGWIFHIQIYFPFCFAI